MLKSDLIAKLMDTHGLSQTRAEAALETFFATLVDALRAGEGIEIRGFGSFHVKDYKAYQGRNPKSGVPIAVKAKRGVLFRTSLELRNRIAAPARKTEPVTAPAEPAVTDAPADPAAAHPPASVRQQPL